MLANEYGRLVQGFGSYMPHGTSMLSFVPHTNISVPNVVVYPQRGNDTIWITLLANEYDHLTQGVGSYMPHGSNKVSFVPHTNIPTSNVVVYPKFCADIRQEKDNEPNSKILRSPNYSEADPEIRKPPANDGHITHKITLVETKCQSDSEYI